MSNIESLFGNSVLHDYKIEKIEIDYPDEIIILQFLDSKSKKKSLVIEQFISIEFNNMQEWGKGTYIVASHVFNTNGILNIEIQLNSGDVCNIKCYKQ